jgi:Cd2+/Zn2+-exporting ATPase
VQQSDLAAGEEKSIWRRREALFASIAGLLLVSGLVLSLLQSDLVLGNVLGRPASVSIFLYLASILFGAYHFARKGFEAIRALSLGINFLMSIAVVGAVIIGEYIEAASLAFLFALAELLEEYSVDRARHSLRELLKLAPNGARIKRNGSEILVPLEEIEIGEVFTVKPGERIALDGGIILGSSTVNQAPITGESVPVEKKIGDAVFAGTINQEGYLEIKVTKHAKDTTLAKIIHLVEEAEAQKAPSERFVDKFAKYYTPSVVAVAVGVATIPPLFLSAPFADWFVRALSLLVISCPCALLISTPVSIVSALTSAARHGVLIKGGVHLEELGQIKAIAIDKTGTFTTSQLEVTDVIPLNDHSVDDVLTVATTLESKSQHPIAQAIVRHYEKSARKHLPESRDFQSITARGVQAEIDGTIYLLGKPELFVAQPPQEFERLESEARTVIVVGRPSRLIGLIAVADQVRPEAKETVQQLKQLGLEVVMITGDNKGTAQAVAKELGIEHYHAGVLPDEKVAEINKLMKQHGKVAMVGDGVNDAPALASATVGIAMGAIGTDAALETADIALMSDDLSKLPYLVTLSRKSRSVIQQNIWVSILTKFSLGVGVFPGYVNLVLAVLVGDMGASLAVTSNALRLAGHKPIKHEAGKGNFRSLS